MTTSDKKSIKYFFVGPPKTGTTWIYEVLKNHVDISLSNQTKELEFFNKNYDKGITWYHNAFDLNGRKSCDISTSYFTSHKACKRIKKYNPEAKIIITIRNPVNRLISHYKHNIRFGIIKKKPILKAIADHPNLVENSLYSKYIRMWISNFGVQNVLVLPLEMLSDQSQLYINKLEKFMNVKIELNESRTSEQVNYASQPKNYFLARSLRKMRKKLNDLGLHAVVRVAKKAGLKKVFYEGGKEIEMNPDDIKSLVNLFFSDVRNLQTLDIPDHIIKEYLVKSHAGK
jgi:hypothetical protein